MSDVETKEPRRIYLIDWSSFKPINNICFALRFLQKLIWTVHFFFLLDCFVCFKQVDFLSFLHLNF